MIMMAMMIHDNDGYGVAPTALIVINLINLYRNVW